MECSRANVMQPIASTSNLNRSPPVRPTPSGNSSTAFNDLASCVDARIQAETFQNSQQLGSDSVLQSSNPVLHIDNTGGGAEDTEMELEEDYNPVASTSAIRPIPLPLPLLRYTVKRAIVPSKTTPNIISFNEKDFEISDGSSDQWPTVFEDLYEESSISYHKEVEPALDHSWRKNIGIYLAQALGLAPIATKEEDHEVWILEKFPQGYKLFVHHSAETRAAKLTSKIWLYGNLQGRLESSYKIMPHFKWLVQKGTKDAKECVKTCLYHPTPSGIQVVLPKQKRISPAGSTDGSQSKKTRKSKALSKLLPPPIPPPVLKEIQPKIEQPIREISPPPIFDGVYADRQRDMDLADGALFRKGELVWVKLSKSILNLQSAGGIIEYWPGMVDERRVVTTSKRVAAVRKANGEKGLPTIKNIQTYSYTVQLLAASDKLTKAEVEMKAWISMVISNVDARELVQPKKTSIQVKVEGSVDIKAVQVSYALALETAGRVSGSYTLVDRYRISKDHISTFNSLNVAETQQKERQAKFWHFQSIWIGPELIWSGECIRILEEAELPKGVSPRTKGSENRSLFLRIMGIMQNSEKKVAQVTGHLYELRVIDPAAVEEAVQLLYMPTPPTGFQFRLLTPPECSLTLDIEYIAGRYYPLPSTLITDEAQLQQILYQYQKEEEVTEVQENLVNSSERTLALAGLLPSYTLFIPVTEWRATRAEAVITSCREAVVIMEEFFESQAVEKSLV